MCVWYRPTATRSDKVVLNFSDSVRFTPIESRLPAVRQTANNLIIPVVGDGTPNFPEPAVLLSCLVTRPPISAGPTNKTSPSRDIRTPPTLDFPPKHYLYVRYTYSRVTTTRIPRAIKTNSTYAFLQLHNSNSVCQTQTDSSYLSQLYNYSFINILRLHFKTHEHYAYELE